MQPLRSDPMPLTGRSRRRIMFLNRARHFLIGAAFYLFPFFMAGIVFEICLKLGVR